MNYLRKIYTKLPETIQIPKELQHIKAEVIILFDIDEKTDTKEDILEFYGSIKNFPEKY